MAVAVCELSNLKPHIRCPPPIDSFTHHTKSCLKQSTERSASAFFPSARLALDRDGRGSTAPNAHKTLLRRLLQHLIEKFLLENFRPYFVRFPHLRSLPLLLLLPLGFLGDFPMIFVAGLGGGDFVLFHSIYLVQSRFAVNDDSAAAIIVDFNAVAVRGGSARTTFFFQVALFRRWAEMMIMIPTTGMTVFFVVIVVRLVLPLFLLDGSSFTSARPAAPRRRRMMLVTVRLTKAVFAAASSRRCRPIEFFRFLSDCFDDRQSASRVLDEILLSTSEGFGERDDVAQRLESVGGGGSGDGRTRRKPARGRFTT